MKDNWESHWNDPWKSLPIQVIEQEIAENRVVREEADLRVALTEAAKHTETLRSIIKAMEIKLDKESGEVSSLKDATTRSLLLVQKLSGLVGYAGGMKDLI